MINCGRSNELALPLKNLMKSAPLSLLSSNWKRRRNWVRPVLLMNEKMLLFNTLEYQPYTGVLGIVPAAALLAVGVRPLAAAFFGFEPSQLDLVTWCTWAFLFGLLGDAWLETAVRSFYANQNTRTPLAAAVIQAVSFVLLAWLLSNWIGLPGIPLAAALTFTAQAIILLSLQDRKFPGLLNMDGTLVRAVLAAIAGGLVAYTATRFLPFSALFSALIGLAAGLVVVLPFIWKEVRLLLHL